MWYAQVRFVKIKFIIKLLNDLRFISWHNFFPGEQIPPIFSWTNFALRITIPRYQNKKKIQINYRMNQFSWLQAFPFLLISR